MLDVQKIQKKEPIQKTNNVVATTICEQIAKQMQAHPTRVAIIDGHTEIHYDDLRQRTHEVAGELKYRGIPPGSLVGVCMHRSWELIATLLGVMQAGCAYVPLDPAYPQDRIRYMLENSRAVAAIVDTEQTTLLCKGVKEVIGIKDIGNHTDTTVHPNASDLAYVIYTSGSTGQPKGVAIEHRGIVAMRQSMRGLFSDEELKGVLAAASVCFDTSVMEIMGTLSLGGTIILAKNALELTKLPAVDQLRTCVMVASAMQAILAVNKLPKNLKCLVFGGEALKHSLVQQVFAQKPTIRVLNAYGPTEDTVYSTIAELYPDTKLVTIGTSVPNSRTYILDTDLQPVSSGASGELHLSGNKLARGYLYDKALTKKRFIEITPNDQIPDHRLYKTGDLCRWADDGNIEFLGRVDQQVKIRGFRIELEEIESTLETMEGIDAVAATVMEGGMGQKILVVYVVSQDTTITVQKMKAYMMERLPTYMVPQVIKYLEALPLLPNDKLDRKKLKTLEAEIRLEQEAYISSLGTNQTNPSEDLIQRLRGSQEAQQATILAIIQSELAALLHFGDPSEAEADHSFNGLGLDSLSTLEFSSRLSNIIGQEVPDQAVFKHATPNALANYIVHKMSNGIDTSTAFKLQNVVTDSLAGFQKHMQSSHPTFQAAKVNAWSVNDKSKLVQEVLRMVNDNRRNPYSKVLRSGSGTRGLVGDAYNDEEQESIIWTTNLYLGLNRDPKVMAEATDALQRYGTGMGTSAAASGMTNQHLEFETEFADLVGKPSACLFPTGYTANVGAIAGVLGKNDVVIIDQLCHASIVDGARLCGASIRTFHHNNATDLEAVLKTEVSPYHTVMVVLEGVYSMGEGAAPVADIVRMAKKYNALVLVDEAHSFGFYGKGGAGICAAQGVTEEVDFIMTTLSKAMGSLGGVVAASQQHVDLMKSSSRAYIFQASVSPADMAAALSALRRLRADDALRERLWITTRYMRKQFEEAGYDLGTGDGPIVTPHFADKDKLYAIVQSLYKKGIQTSAVTYPIVEMGRGRLRLICSAAHTKEDVDKTLQALIEAEQEVDIQLAKKQHKTTDTNIKSTDLKDWSASFTEYLKRSVVESSIPTPDLAILVQVLDTPDPIIFLIKDDTVILTTHIEEALPTCSLLLTNLTAVNALQTGDVQAILDSICDGSCILKGQVEAFVWLMARMVEREVEW